MTLTDLQKTQLQQREASLSANKLAEYIMKYDNLSLEDFPRINDEKRVAIQHILNSFPNPNEQEEWKQIAGKLNNVDEYSDANTLTEALTILNNYIRNWEVSLPQGNSVEKAKSKRTAVENWIKGIEQRDWDNVDIFSIDSLLNHLKKYPESVYKDEIDNSVWGILEQNPTRDYVKKYIKHFPHGNHIGEAHALLSALDDWEGVRKSDDIFELNDYIKNNPNSPLINEARNRLYDLKQDELYNMRQSPMTYSSNRFERLIAEKVFSEEELIQEDVITRNILNILRNRPTMPDIENLMSETRAFSTAGNTDVYFFGIPATGKTCVLMGLSRATSLDINLANEGGEYAEALMLYTMEGMIVPPTNTNFITSLDASTKSTDGTTHKINLIEMAGEQFAFDMVKDPKKDFGFESMGKGATRLLSNNNRKVFFLIIDPTSLYVPYTRTIETVDNDGNIQYKTIDERINQSLVLQKFVNILNNPSNKEIMKKVDSLHIIMTKADTLGEPEERDERAKEIFDQYYRDSCLSQIIECCEENNINTNATRKFHPNLYTFSLGKFYIGNYYEYNPTDANKLVEVIKNSTRPTKKKSMWERVKDKLN
ncbi:MAG: hypothetical protein ACI4TS_04805 [Bacteroidaceae bacterium]